jgi:hypothetical protein
MAESLQVQHEAPAALIPSMASGVDLRAAEDAYNLKTRRNSSALLTSADQPFKRQGNRQLAGPGSPVPVLQCSYYRGHIAQPSPYT